MVCRCRHSPFFISFFLLFKTCLVLAWIFGADLPNSKFFRQTDHERLRRIQFENSERDERANLHLSQRKTPADTSNYESGLSGRTKIHVVVVTTPRPGDFRCLTQTVTEMKFLVDKQNAFEVNVTVCSAAEAPHPEAEALKAFFPVVQKQHHFYRDVFEKEKQDYVFCLKHASSNSAATPVDFVLMLEDDAYPEAELFEVLDHILHQRRKRLQEVQQALYFKLYHPERLLGYLNPEPERIVEWVLVSSLLGAVLRFVFSFCLEQCDVRHWLCYTLLVMVVLEVVGRNNLLQVRRLSRSLFSLMPAPDCCTQAILLPWQRIQEVVDAMEAPDVKTDLGASTPKDVLLDSLRKRSSSYAFAVEPNLFKHIGFYTTLRNKGNATKIRINI